MTRPLAATLGAATAALTGLAFAPANDSEPSDESFAVEDFPPRHSDTNTETHTEPRNELRER